MKKPNRLTIIILISLLVIIALLWFKNNNLQKQRFQAQQEIRKKTLSNDSLTFYKGVYSKYVADTLTRGELKKLAAQILDLQNRQPISVTKTIIQPVEIRKETDSVRIEKDTVYIKDYYPNKGNPFLTYTNNFSIKDTLGRSTFNFSPIALSQVITKKENGLYQVDFKGPDFLELKSLDIQTEPMEAIRPDNFGILIGADYIKDITENQQHLGINSYIRYKKFYIGAGATTQGSLNAGIKVEF